MKCVRAPDVCSGRVTRQTLQAVEVVATWEAPVGSHSVEPEGLGQGQATSAEQGSWPRGQASVLRRKGHVRGWAHEGPKQHPLVAQTSRVER